MALHQNDGGHEFNRGIAFPLHRRWCVDGDSAIRSDLTCSGCQNGICASSMACHVPEPEPAPEPRTRFALPRSRAFWIGGGMALAGAALFAFDGLKHFMGS